MSTHIKIYTLRNVFCKQNIFYNWTFKQESNPFEEKQIFYKNVLSMLQSIFHLNIRIFSKYEYAYVCNNWSNGFYHWVAEVLPRVIYLSNEYPNLKFIFPFELYSQYHLSSLNFLGIDFESDKKKWKYFSKVYVSQKDLRTTGSHNFNDLNLLKLRFEPAFSVSQSNVKIYIVRNVFKRVVVNDTEIIQIFRDRDYQILELENLSFFDQIQHFVRANTIVSIHGAGLTNMIFMPPKSRVLEFIKPTELQKTCYANLSFVLRHEYLHFDGIPSIEFTSYQDCSLYIDPIALISFLNSHNL
jgi:hypothetical protein